MYQETRFLNQDACFLNQEGRRQFLISYGGTETEKSAMLHEESRPFLPIPALDMAEEGIEELARRIIRSAQEGVISS